MTTHENTYQRSGFSERYGRAIDELIVWWTAELQGREPFNVTASERTFGIDALPEDIKALARLAYGTWVSDRDYNLSYNQMCIAFFHAAEAAGVVTSDNPGWE